MRYKNLCGVIITVLFFVLGNCSPVLIALDKISPENDRLGGENSHVFFPTPEGLAKRIFEILKGKNSSEFSSIIPGPDYFEEWFSQIPPGDENCRKQQDWLLNRAKEMKSGGAEKLFSSVRSKMEKKGVVLADIASFTAKIQPKYFYEEADIFIQLNEHQSIKLKDCIKTPKGWIFISEIKIKSKKKPVPKLDKFR